MTTHRNIGLDATTLFDAPPYAQRAELYATMHLLDASGDARPPALIEATAAYANALNAMGLTLPGVYVFGQQFPLDFDAAHRLARAFPRR